MAEETKKIYRLSTGRNVRVAADKETAFLEKHPNAEFIMVEVKEDVIPTPIDFRSQVVEQPDVTHVTPPSLGKLPDLATDVTQGQDVESDLLLGDTSSDSQEYEVLGGGIKSRSSEDWLIVDWMPELDKTEPTSDVVEPELEILGREEDTPLVDETDIPGITSPSTSDGTYLGDETGFAVTESTRVQPPVYFNSVNTYGDMTDNEHLPEWMRDAEVYSLIHKYKDLVPNWTDQPLTTEEEFWSALEPVHWTTTEKYWSIGTKTKDGYVGAGWKTATTHHRKIGNIPKEGNYEKYTELELLWEVHQTVQSIRSREAGDVFIDLTDSEVLQKHYSPDAETDAYISLVDKGVLPASDELAEDYNQPDIEDPYTIADYENEKNRELTANLLATSTDQLAKFKTESQASLEALQLELTEAYLPGIKTMFAVEIATAEASWLSVQQEITDDFQRRFDDAFGGDRDVPTEAEIEEWDKELVLSLRAAQEDHFKTVNGMISTAMESSIKTDDKYHEWETEIASQFEVAQKTLLDNYVKSYKYDYNLWDTDDLNNIGNMLEANYRFSSLAAPDRIKLLDAAFKDYMRDGTFSNASEADLKNEFYHFFYDKLTTNAEGERTQFYWKALAQETKANEEQVIRALEFEALASGYGGDMGGATLLAGAGGTPGEEAMLTAKTALKWANDVLENPEKYDDMGGSAFWSGFTSHHGIEYIPFISGIASYIDNKQIENIQEKFKNGIKLSQSEKSLLQISAIKQQSDKLVSDMSMSYNAGSMLAHSVPFIGEFILTAGVFTEAKIATQAAMRTKIATNINKTRKVAGVTKGGARVSKDGSKILFASRAEFSAGAKFVDAMAEPLSMLMGVTAQTLANPVRIADNTVMQMHDQMLFAFTTDADEALEALSADVILAGTEEAKGMGMKEGEGFGWALTKGFGLSWSEIFTENLGAYFLPLGNRVKKSLFAPDGALGGLTHNNEFLSRLALGRLMRRYGFTRSSEVVEWSRKAAGWNGFAAEFMEEMINMPMSNFISGGGTPLGQGIFDYDPLTGRIQGMDWRNLGTIGMSVGAGATVFSGGAVVANKVMGNKAPAYFVDHKRFDSWKEAKTYLLTMKAKGLLNADLDVEIQNDYVAYNEAADYLKKNGINEDIIKVNKQGTLGDQITATEVEMLNAASAEQRQELSEIDKKIEGIQSQIAEEEQSNKSKRAKSKAISALQAELAKLNESKSSITKPLITSIESKKSEKVFKETLESVEKINTALRKAGKKNVKITRKKTQGGARAVALERFFGMKVDGVSEDGTVRYIDTKTGLRVQPSKLAELVAVPKLNEQGEQVKNKETGEVETEMITREELINRELDGAQISHGYFLKSEGKEGTKGYRKAEIVINQEASLNRSGGNVAAHEFLHFFLNEALEQSAEMKLALGTVFQQYINQLDPRAIRNSEFRKRLGVYQSQSLAVQAEEAMALFLDAMANGELQYNESVFTKIGDVLRHIFNRMGVTIKLKEGRDVYNFLKDFNKNIQRGELSNSMIKAMEGTIEIGGTIEAVQERVSETVAKEREELRKKLSLELGDNKDILTEESFDKLLDYMSGKGILFSKDVTKDVNDLGNMGWDQESWDSQGADFAMETMIAEQMLDGLIAKKLKFKDSKGSAEIEDFIAKVYANLVPLVRNFNRGKWGTEEQNDSLYGWVNAQIANRATEVWNASQKPTEEKWAADIEATTSEGAPLFQIAAEQDKLMDDIDNITLGDIVLNEEQKVIYSQFRQDLGLSEDMMNVVRDVVVQTFGRKLPKVGSKQFKMALEEAYRNELKTPIQDMMGKGANYDLFLEEKFEIIYTQLSKETLIQMERKIPEEFRIFTKKRRITKPTEVDALIEQELLPKDTNRLSGPNLVEKLPYPGIEKVMAYFRGSYTDKTTKVTKSMQEVLGYKKGTSTLGTRKDGLAKYIGQELAFDATFEVLERDNVQDRFLETIEMTEGEVLGNEIAMVLKQIDRQPGIMFSKSKYESDARTLHEEVKVYGFENIFPDGKLSNEYKDLLPEAVATIKHIWETGKVSTEEELRFKAGVLKIDGLNKDDQAIVDAYGKIGNLRNANNIGQLQDLHRDNIVLAQYLGEDFVNAVGYEFMGYVYRVMDSAAKKRGKPGESGPWFDALNSLKNKVKGRKGKSIDAALRIMNKGQTLFRKVEKLQNMEISAAEKVELFNAVDSKTGVSLAQEVEAANKANIEAATTIAYGIIHLAQKGKISKTSALHLLQIQTGIVNGFRGVSSLDLIEWRDGSQAATVNHPSYNEAVDFYLNEMNEVKDKETGKKRKRTRAEAEQKALESLESKGEHLKPNSNTMLELSAMLFQEDVTTEQIQEAFKDHSQFLGSKYLMDVLDHRGGRNNKSNFDRIKLLNQSDIAAVRGIQGVSYEDVMLDRISFSKPVNSIDKSNAAKLKNQQNARLTYDENTESRGMSTFDFDETLIIEGENFVTATHPKTGEVTKISSGNWPLEGPKMTAQGYEFDFSDFVNVRGGVEGPLLQKMRNQIEKYGADNVFVLTARQQESATAIYEWLKTQGISLPFENITGLGKSEGSAKGEWMLQKYAEGYNDMYFVDDALPNVEAVKQVLEALDIKSKVVQARIMFSKDASGEFNEMLERNKDIDAKKTFSAAEARRRGAKKGRFEFFIPPSAEDFKGLMYKLLGRGEQGEQDLAWVEDNLIGPYAKGIRDYNAMKQKIAGEFRALSKKGLKLKKNVAGTSFTTEQAIRIYLFDKAGYEIPGLAKTTKNTLINHVNGNSDLINYANGLSNITRTENGYIEPTEFWDLGTIASDMRSLVEVNNRGEFLAEWKANRDAVFSEENLNKLEALFGTNYRDALENMLYRMETGSNRTTGANDKVVNNFLDWINGSVGAVMFFNTRSAVLQTISTVNFIDFEDNNMFKAAAAFANAPQFWADFAYIFNSDTLKQRRSGLQMDVNAEELTDAFNTGKGPKAVLQYLLQIGFTPTQLADSFAISLGGASYYRNKVKANIKRGMSQQEAEAAAWLSFQEKSEETQQSSRPDFISQQQAGVLGRLVLAWQNTPMQMTRLTKKAVLDLINGRGDPKANISKIIYYGFIQNVIFGTLQSGLAFIMFGDDEEEIKKKELRVANGVLDTLLRGTGVYGAAAATIKNTLLQWDAQRKKGYGKQDWSKISQDIINLSPPMGSKHRKILGSVKGYEYNEDVINEMDYGIDNPMWSIGGNVVEGVTNMPVGRVVNKANNIDEAINGNMEMWQRAALLLGWNRWDIGVKDEDIEAAKVVVKEKKEVVAEEKKKQKKIEKEAERQAENETVIEGHVEEQEQQRKDGVDEEEIKCAAVKRNGERCGKTVLSGQTYCTVHEEVEQRADGEKKQCSHTKTNGDRCKMQTTNKSGKCYYHD